MTTELSAVGEVINRLHQEICEHAQSSYVKALQIGELLCCQKERQEHGDWLDWLRFNCPSIPERTASRYMGIFRDHGKVLEEEATGKTANLADTWTVYQLLTGIFSIEDEEEDPKNDTDKDEDDDDDDDKETNAEHSDQHINGDEQERARKASVKSQDDSGRPSPQDIIRAANQLEMTEKCIAAGMKPFLEVSEALLLVKQNRLYEIAHFRSFEEYCSDKWGFNYRLTKRNSG